MQQMRHYRPVTAWAQFAVLIFVLTLMMLLVVLVLFYRAPAVG